MQATEHCRAELDQLLRESVLCATGLKEILKDERVALEQQNPQALSDTAASKQAFMSELEDLEARRREICAANGFDPDAGAMDAFVAWCDRESLLSGNWAQFVELARTCSAMNISNGTIINLRRQQIVGALSVIRGDTGDNGTYGRNGRDTGSTANRVLLEI